MKSGGQEEDHLAENRQQTPADSEVKFDFFIILFSSDFHRVSSEPAVQEKLYINTSDPAA